MDSCLRTVPKVAIIHEAQACLFRPHGAEVSPALSRPGTSPVAIPNFAARSTWLGGIQGTACAP